MHRNDNHVLHIARFTLQARTALSIGTGGPDSVYDHPIVRDANGLPIIPGTSLAGVLRQLWLTDHGLEARAADDLFGYQRRDRGAASRLEVSACVLQDSNGRPVEGLLLGPADEARMRDDSLLRAARATLEDPLFRDRVRLTHRGVADHRGKFDRGLVAAGHRFSGELRLWSASTSDPDWTPLLALLADPRLRLGGATRAGLGALELIDLYSASLDLRQPSDVHAFRQLGAGIGERSGLSKLDPKTLPLADVVTVLTVQLKARDFWRIGQGDGPVGNYAKEPDLVPKLEPVVDWSTGRGTLSNRVALVPGSSVKGALSHRTAFHWNALNGRFADDLSLDELSKWDKAEDCDGVRALFGYAKNRETASGRSRDETGRAGLVVLDDIRIDLSAQAIQAHVQAMIHNSLDRFTGGVRARMLFTEELLYRHDFALRVTLLPGIDRIDSSARRALARSLLDLCSGRLGLGGGTTKGHGIFVGTPDAPTQAWLSKQGEPWPSPNALEDAA
jgi:CRISPR/Cas system CSM-associated protein Csm3 (group 7 of RAMP superfamily)